MVNHTEFEFQACSELGVIDYVPELAGVANPRGAVIGPVWYILATDHHGNRCQSDELTETKAKQRSDRLNALSEAGVTVTLCFWRDFYPVYGSDAYSSSDERVWEESLDRKSDDWCLSG